MKHASCSIMENPSEGFSEGYALFRFEQNELNFNPLKRWLKLNSKFSFDCLRVLGTVDIPTSDTWGSDGTVGGIFGQYICQFMGENWMFASLSSPSLGQVPQQFTTEQLSSNTLNGHQDKCVRVGRGTLVSVNAYSTYYHWPKVSDYISGMKHFTTTLINSRNKLETILLFRCSFLIVTFFRFLISY